jgi:hypothetical protein
MVVKIMKNAANFAAVGYNEKRVKEGGGRLVAVRNFGGAGELCSTSADYRKYLEDWSRRNSRIKYPQLHAVISCKGQELTPQQLTDIADRWMRGMGYGDCPYLVYYHHDTDNAHVHIVSTRVGTDGRKIADSFEKERSRKVMNRIAGMDAASALRRDVAKALRYSFSSPTQFRCVLESMGCKTKENTDKDTLAISRNGERLSLPSSLIDWSSGRYRHDDKKRRKQIAQLIRKYAPRMDLRLLPAFFKVKFGVELQFFGKEESPYGYAVIDHSGKAVYAGRDILPVKDIVRLCGQRGTDFHEVLSALTEALPGITRKKLNAKLKQQGYELKKDNILDRKTKSVLYKLNADEKNLLDYNGKIQYILDRHPIRTEGERNHIARLYHVRADDLPVGLSNQHPDVIEGIRDLISDALDEGTDRGDFERSAGLRVIRQDGEWLFYDPDSNQVFSNQTLGIPAEALDLWDSDPMRGEDEKADEVERAAMGEDLVESVLEAIQHTSGGTQKYRRKKR